MHAENATIHDGTEREVVEDFAAPSPDVATAVFALARLVVEPGDFRSIWRDSWLPRTSVMRSGNLTLSARSKKIFLLEKPRWTKSPAVDVVRKCWWGGSYKHAPMNRWLASDRSMDECQTLEKNGRLWRRTVAGESAT